MTSLSTCRWSSWEEELKKGLLGLCEQNSAEQIKIRLNEHKVGQRKESSSNNLLFVFGVNPELGINFLF